MLIPWLQGILSWEKAPMTWVLIHINILIFAITMDYLPTKDESYFSVPENLVLTGKIYQQFVSEKNITVFENKKKMDKKEILQRTDYILMGAKAIKDPQFISVYNDLKIFGDEIQIQLWKDAFGKYLKSIQRRPSSIFGLQTSDFKFSQWKKWITYQFMHANFMHLIGNLGILVIFGAALELLIGGIPLLIIYVCSGLFGALGFLLLSDASTAPMIGASGSISGIMSYYVFREWRKNISFFYFISPIKDYYGFIYLPVWTLLPLSFLPDLNAYLTTPKELGSGVANTAHLGGAFLGVLLGAIFIYYRSNDKSKSFLRPT